MGLLRWRRFLTEGADMSDSRFKPVDAPERETAKEPPKRWFNWYACGSLPGRLVGTHIWVNPGEAYRGTVAWPSKDVAESEAARWLERLPQYLAQGGKYLGAFPEGEAP